MVLCGSVEKLTCKIVEVLAVAYVIKRYANRKLYDPQESRYVTLEELAEKSR